MTSTVGLASRITSSTILLVLISGIATAAPGDPMEGAQKRIDKYRKADATVRVVDGNGKPIRGVEVEVAQTRHAFLFGCNIYLLTDPDADADPWMESYLDRFEALFNYATLPFYWQGYEPRRGEPNHARTERVARWCRERGITTKGHPLVWNVSEPGWLPGDLDEVRALQLARIGDCVTRFEGLIDIWDVVNEPSDYLRPWFREAAPKLTSLWERDGQIDFPRACFAEARRGAPGATLIVNDYVKGQRYADVIAGLNDAEGKRLYDVIGIQTHSWPGMSSNKYIWNYLERFAAFGVPIHFTETTVVSGENRIGIDFRGYEEDWPTTPEGEARQLEEVERFYTLLFSHPSVEAITWWDFSDRQAWLGAPAGLLREDMSPKPAYDRLLELIKGEWWTHTRVTTSRRGKAKFRGFLGDYAITARIQGRPSVTKHVTLDRSGASIEIVMD